MFSKITSRRYSTNNSGGIIESISLSNHFLDGIYQWNEKIGLPAFAPYDILDTTLFYTSEATMIKLELVYCVP